MNSVAVLFGAASKPPSGYISCANRPSNLAVFFCREETFPWSLSSAQMDREDVFLLDLVNWMKNMKEEGIKDEELRNKTFCHNLKYAQS